MDLDRRAIFILDRVNHSGGNRFSQKLESFSYTPTIHARAPGRYLGSAEAIVLTMSL